MPDAIPPELRPPRRGGIKTMLVLVATSAVVLAAAMRVRDQLDPTRASLLALRSADVGERRAAAVALVELKPAEFRAALPSLALALGDGDALVRQDVVDALGRGVRAVAADPAARPEVAAGVRALIEALEDPAEPVRDQAARHLATFLKAKPGDGDGDGDRDGDRGRVAVALTRAALDRRSPRVQEVAATALALAGPAGEIAPPAELAAAVGDPDRPGDVRGVAAALLGSFPVARPAALGPLVALLGDPSPMARRGAAAGLAQLDPIALRPAIPALLDAAARPFEPPAPGPEGLALGWTASPPAVIFFDPTGGQIPFGLFNDPGVTSAARRATRRRWWRPRSPAWRWPSRPTTGRCWGWRDCSATNPTAGRPRRRPWSGSGRVPTRRARHWSRRSAARPARSGIAPPARRARRPPTNWRPPT